MLKRENLLVVWLVGAFALFVFSSCNQLVNYSNQHSGKVAAITSKRIYGDLTVLDLKTMQLTVMAESDFVNHDPEWFPDGKTIIFSSDTSDDQGLFTSKLLVLNSLTGEMKEIQSTPGLNRQPSVSPDGDWVAFNGATISEEIYVLNLASLSLTNVSNSPARDQSPDWSPDGRQIVFSSNRSGKWQIYIMNKDGTDLGQLTNEEANNKRTSVVARWKFYCIFI
jgi:TolB protein